MSKLILYKCETPMHVGAGSELGVVDMPIQRERPTGFPKIEASSLKGSFRNNFEKDEEQKAYTEVLFGPEKDGSEYSSTLQFTDGRILLFPVKSAYGIFAWITCPFIINRFNNDMGIMGVDGFEINVEKETELEKDSAITTSESDLIIKDKDNKEYIMLEEFGYKVIRKEKNIFDKLIDQVNLDDYSSKKIKKDIVVVHDEIFRYFVEMSTEVNIRIRIGNEGVVEEGGLFTEEYLPSETIMYNFIKSSVPKVSEDKIKKYLGNKNKNINENNYNSKAEDKFEEYLEENPVIQIGGNSTLGKGLVSNYVVKKGDGNGK